ncbi:hypothetical protein ACTXL6_20600 [Brachybacterium tyrofermentans]|uniref:hypothetical protein n=1 Tax=Brachybacterium tyrofermentans TaxID=47848 RepID=UPI003FD237A1
MATTITDEQHTIARNYVSDYWSDHVDEIGLRRALGDPITLYDEEIGEYDDLEDYLPIAGAPLRDSLRIPEEMFEAMVTAHENVLRKVDAQHDDSLAPGANERYNAQASRCATPAVDSFSGLFDGLASCQGGDEPSLIYGHPVHGLDRPGLVSEDEYRRRTSPYVAAFGREVYPGDLEAGLVLDEVRHYLA